MTKSPVKCCLVKGCGNHSDGGTFVGDLCMPCHQMLTTGEVHPMNPTFIGGLYRVSSLLKKLVDALSIAELIQYQMEQRGK